MADENNNAVGGQPVENRNDTGDVMQAGTSKQANETLDEATVDLKKAYDTGSYFSLLK